MSTNRLQLLWRIFPIALGCWISFVVLDKTLADKGSLDKFLFHVTDRVALCDLLNGTCVAPWDCAVYVHSYDRYSFFACNATSICCFEQRQYFHFDTHDDHHSNQGYGVRSYKKKMKKMTKKKKQDPVKKIIYSVTDRVALCELLNGTCVGPHECAIFVHSYNKKHIKFDCNFTAVCCYFSYGHGLGHGFGYGHGGAGISLHGVGYGGHGGGYNLHRGNGGGYGQQHGGGYGQQHGGYGDYHDDYDDHGGGYGHEDEYDYHSDGYDDHGGGYDDHGGGYDDHGGGYDEHGGGYDDRGGGYDDHGGGYDDHGGGYDDHGGGYDDHDDSYDDYGGDDDRYEHDRSRYERKPQQRKTTNQRYKPKRRSSKGDQRRSYDNNDKPRQQYNRKQTGMRKYKSRDKGKSGYYEHQDDYSRGGSKQGYDFGHHGLGFGHLPLLTNSNLSEACITSGGVCTEPGQCATSSKHTYKRILCNLTAICCLPDPFPLHSGYGHQKSSYGHDDVIHKVHDGHAGLGTYGAFGLDLLHLSNRTELCAAKNGTCLNPEICIDTDHDDHAYGNYGNKHGSSHGNQHHKQFYCNLTTVCCLPKRFEVFTIKKVVYEPRKRYTTRRFRYGGRT